MAKGVSQRSLKGMRRSDRYTLPPMPFSLSADEALALPDTTPGVNGAEEILLPVGRGVWRLIRWRTLDRVLLRRIRHTVTVLDFG